MIKKRVLHFASVAIFAILATSTAGAQTLAVTEPARLVKLPQLTANAEQTLFSLMYALQPMCNADHRAWSHGGSVYLVGKKSEVKGSAMMVGFLEILNQEVLFAEEKFGAKSGQKLVLADQPLSPLGFAGVKKGDIFTFSEDSPLTEATASSQTATQADSSRASEPQGLEARLERRKSLKDKTDKKYSENPIQDLVIWKEGKSGTSSVRMVNKCGMTISARDSKYSYAHAAKGSLTDGSLLVSAPFLESVSPVELKSMLALESAHYALGYSSNPAGSAAEIVVSTLLLGGLAKIGTNGETGVRAAQEKDLMESDKLALLLVQELGVSATEYFDALKKFDSLGSIFAPTSYSQNRTLGQLRTLELKAAIARTNSALPDARVASVTNEIYASVIARMKSVVANPDLLFSLSKPIVVVKP